MRHSKCCNSEPKNNIDTPDKTNYLHCTIATTQSKREEKQLTGDCQHSDPVRHRTTRMCTRRCSGALGACSTDEGVAAAAWTQSNDEHPSRGLSHSCSLAAPLQSVLEVDLLLY